MKADAFQSFCTMDLACKSASVILQDYYKLMVYRNLWKERDPLASITQFPGKHIYPPALQTEC
jgi:hypothetical protein